VTVRRALAALLAVQALALWLVARTSYFRQDDFQYFAEMHRSGGRFSEAWLTSIWYKHMAPGHRFMYSLLDFATPGAYRWSLLFEIVLMVIAGLALFGVLRLLFGTSWWLLVPVAVLGFSHHFATPLIWPAAGFQIMPSAAASLVCLYGYLRFIADRSWPWLAASVLALSLGLCFYVRPLLVLPLILALQILFLSPSLRPAAVVRGLLREWPAWLALLVPPLVYTVIYLRRDAFGHSVPLTFDEVQQYVRTAWLRNVAPSFLGARLPAGGLSARHVIFEALGQVLFLGLLALSLWRKGLAALRGWGFAFVAVALTFALTAKGKLEPARVAEVGFDSRYVTDLMWLIPLGVFMALAPRRVAVLGAEWPEGERLRPFPAPLARLLAPRTVAGLVGALVLAVTLVQLHARDTVAQQWQAREGRKWVLNARTSAQRLADAGRRVRVADGLVPPSVDDSSFIGAYSYRSVILPLIQAPVDIGVPATGAQLPDGTIVPAAMKPHAVVRPGQGTTLTGLTRRGGCLVAGAAAEGLVDAPLPAPASGLAVTVRAGGAGRLPAGGVGVDIDSGYGLPAAPQRTLPAVGRREVDTGETKVVRLRFHVPPGGRLCGAAFTVAALEQVR
jgi:hypothetical protein